MQNLFPETRVPEGCDSRVSSREERSHWGLGEGLSAWGKGASPATLQGRVAWDDLPGASCQRWWLCLSSVPFLGATQWSWGRSPWAGRYCSAQWWGWWCPRARGAHCGSSRPSHWRTSPAGSHCCRAGSCSSLDLEKWRWGQGEGNKLSMLLVMREQNPYFCRFPWYFAAVSLRLPSISARAMLRWVAEMLLIRGKKNIINMWHSRNNYAVIFFFYSLKTINSTFKDVSCLHNLCQSNPRSLTYIF